MQKLEPSQTSPRFDREEKDYIRDKLLRVATSLLFAVQYSCDCSSTDIFSSDWEYLENYVFCAIHELEKLSKLAGTKLEGLNAKTGS